MTDTLKPQRFDWVLQRGMQNVRSWSWMLDNGWVWWKAGATHAVGDVVKVSPDLNVLVQPVVSADGRTLLQSAVTTPGLFLRCTGISSGVSGSSLAVPIVNGAVITDGGVTWLAQTNSQVPVDLTNYQAERRFRPSPDDPNAAPTLDIGTANLAPPLTGITLAQVSGVWVITETVTAANIETLIAAWTRGYSDIKLTPPNNGQPVIVEFGVVNIRQVATR